MSRYLFLFVTGAFLAAGCQSITVVNKKPGREDVADLLRRSLTCEDDAPAVDPLAEALSLDDDADARDASDDSAQDEKKCDPSAQPVKIELTALQCEARPLRPGVAEAAYARCEWAGSIIRADGARAPLPVNEGDFSLLNLTPGAYRPLYEWSYDDTH
ncbi:MAG: hypothetical protein R3C60_11185 [Parvularculaceae bacterium]